MPKILESVNETILKEAKELLINSDYDTFNIRELSRKCNISVGTIYNYFPNKYELVRSIFYEDWNKSLERMKNINSIDNSLKLKINQVYLEMNSFLEEYLIIFLQITSKCNIQPHPPGLTSLYPLIDEILNYEREKGSVSSPLYNEKLTKFIINNLLLLCTDNSLTFDEIYSLMNL